MPLPALTGVPVEPTARARHDGANHSERRGDPFPDRKAATPAKLSPARPAALSPLSQHIGHTVTPGAGVRLSGASPAARSAVPRARSMSLTFLASEQRQLARNFSIRHAVEITVSYHTGPLLVGTCVV